MKVNIKRIVKSSILAVLITVGTFIGLSLLYAPIHYRIHGEPSRWESLGYNPKWFSGLPLSYLNSPLLELKILGIIVDLVYWFLFSYFILLRDKSKRQFIKTLFIFVFIFLLLILFNSQFYYKISWI